MTHMDHPPDLTENVIYRPGSVLPLFHVPILMLTCVFWHLSIMASITFSAIWATVVLLCDRTRRDSLHFPCTSVSLWHPWPQCRFTICPTLQHFWYVLTNAYQEHPIWVVFLEMLWHSRLPITIWPLSESLIWFQQELLFLKKYQHLP